MPYMRDTDGSVFHTDTPEYHKGCVRLSEKEGKSARKEYVREQLRKVLVPGQRVYTIVRHVSRSGMSRRIDVYRMDHDAQRGCGPVRITRYVAEAIGAKCADDGVVMGGCGMDMGFALVYELGHALWPNGTPAPHGTRNGEPDSGGGYALKQEWM